MAVGAGLFIVLLMRTLMNETKRLSRKFSAEATTLNRYLIQILQSFKYLKATGRFKYLQDSADESIVRASNLQKETQYISAIFTAIQEPIAVLFMLGIMFYQVVFLEQSLTPILVTLVLFYRAMNTLLLSQTLWQTLIGSVGGLEMMVDEFDEVKKHQELRGEELLGSFKDSINVSNITFGYTQETILSNLNLNIDRNSTVALVGESGSGKSTLVDLITLLLSPQEGMLTIDKASTKSIDKDSWREKIGLVTQEVVIFDDTIANNITLWQGNFTSDKDVQNRVKLAAQQANCNHFISAFPKGYNTQIGERGIRLSGGQKQRLAIARELYKKPELLILDEATSALDSASERAIQESIDALKGKITVIVIAHRLSTIRNADKIVVLDKGTIKEEGTFVELVARGEYFKEMTDLQKV